MPPDGTILALLQAQQGRIDTMSCDIAVLKDRRADNEGQDRRIESLAARILELADIAAKKAAVKENAEQIRKLQDELLASRTRWRMIAALVGAGSVVGGAGAAKIIGLLGG